MRTFLKAASRRGVPGGLLDAVARAAADFERLVATHADDRSTFDSMVSSLAATERAGQITLQQKRSAFRANRHIWGVMARTHLRCVLVQAAQDPRLLDVARIEGLIKLRQLRRDAPLIITRARVVEDDGTVRQPGWKTLDPEGETTHGFALLREFCSQPPPRFRAVEGEGGFVHGELVSNGVGNRGAITCIDGHLAYGVASRYRDEHNRYGAHSAVIRLPCEVLVLDLLVREGTFGPIAPVGVVYGGPLGESSIPAHPPARDLLPLHEAVVCLGRGPSALHTPDVPRYAELARYVLKRLGWDGEEFQVYRYRMEYPVLRSVVVVRFDLPAPP